MKSTLGKKKIPSKDIFFFRQRFKNKIFQSVLSYFADLAKEKNLAKKDIANLLDKDPSQITRWFSGPNNWTLDTISDLLLAMDAELKHEIVPLHESRQQKMDVRNITEHSAELGASILKIHDLLAGNPLPSVPVHTPLQPWKYFEPQLQHDSSMLGVLKGSGQEISTQKAVQTLKPSSQTQSTQNTLSDSAALIH